MEPWTLYKSVQSVKKKVHRIPIKQDDKYILVLPANPDFRRLFPRIWNEALGGEVPAEPVFDLHDFECLVAQMPLRSSHASLKKVASQPILQTHIGPIPTPNHAEQFQHQMLQTMQKMFETIMAGNCP